MKGEAAIGFDNLFCRFWLAEHIAHRQVAAIELRIPDHLPQPGQDHQVAAAVLHPQPFHAAGVAKRRHREVIILQQSARLFSKERAPQGKLRHRDSPQEAVASVNSRRTLLSRQK